LDASPPLLRRRWSEDAKMRVLTEALAPGANVSAVARAHGVSPQQVFAWKRKALRSGVIASVEAEAEAPAFAPVALSVTGMLEILVGDVTIRAGSSVTAARLVEAIRAARSA
jgi:transposase